MMNANRSLIIDNFSPDRRITANDNFLKPTMFSTEIKNFLEEVGVPIVAALNISFNLMQSFPKWIPNHVLISLGSKGQLQSELIMLQEQFGIAISVENRSRGALWEFDLTGKSPLRFINKDIEVFAAFLALYEQMGKKFRAMPEQEAELRFRDEANMLETRMADIDPSAFAESSNWWVIVIGEMKHGIM